MRTDESVSQWVIQTEGRCIISGRSLKQDIVLPAVEMKVSGAALRKGEEGAEEARGLGTILKKLRMEVWDLSAEGLAFLLDSPWQRYIKFREYKDLKISRKPKDMKKPLK